jgi:two-component system, probable response regulator PhcQ
MKSSVLLVDDDDKILYGLGRALHNQPYKLLTAKSGDEAMWILKAHEVAVIVADERMTGISGGDLLAWAAANVPDTIRIMLTGNAAASIAIRAINEGRVYHFFTKPCDEVQLAITLRKALEYREMLTENHRLLATNQQQFDELQQFSKKLRLLARVVAKDLRMPLDQVTHSCSALTNQYAEFFDPKAKKLLENTTEAVSEVQHIVDDLIQQTRSNVLTDLSSQQPSVSAPVEVEGSLDQLARHNPVLEWDG